MFDVARYWRISPFEVEKLEISQIIELVDQANRIHKKELDAWQQANPTLSRRF